jgi:hypothetical protein
MSLYDTVMADSSSKKPGSRFRRRGQTCVLPAIAGILLVLGACGTGPEPRDDVLDPRLAGPCDRLILSWSEDVASLRALVGDGFEPRTADTVGEMQLNVLRCKQERGRQPPLTFAFLSVPISADSAPLVITRMPDDGWAWLADVIVNTDSLAVFSTMGYPVKPAEIEFAVDVTGNHASIAADLIFASGLVSVAARTAGKETVYAANQALVSTDHQYHSVFFGKETADRYELVSVDINVQGDTPLAVVDPDRQPERAVLDSGLRLDHVYWRLPRSQPSLEPVRREEP